MFYWLLAEQPNSSPGEYVIKSLIRFGVIFTPPDQEKTHFYGIQA